MFMVNYFIVGRLMMGFGSCEMVLINVAALSDPVSTGIGDRSRVHVTFSLSWYLINHPG